MTPAEVTLFTALGISDEDTAMRQQVVALILAVVNERVQEMQGPIDAYIRGEVSVAIRKAEKDFEERLQKVEGRLFPTRPTSRYEAQWKGEIPRSSRYERNSK